MNTELNDNGIRDVKSGHVPDENIWNEEIIRQWAYGNRILYLADPQSFGANLATEALPGDQEKRLDLLAELISDNQVNNVKKRILLLGLYERLKYGLAYNRSGEWSNEEIRENAERMNKSTFKWSKKNITGPRHPAVLEFSKDAVEKIENWDKYNANAIDQSGWELIEHKKIMEWFPDQE